MRAAAWAAWAVPLVVYACSICSFPATWDTAEAQTVPWIFGIMHPTGFPAYTMLGGVFAHVFPFGSVAWRMGFFSALAMSGTAWLVWRIAVLLECEAWTATAGAWLFAFGAVAWTRGTRAEVHTLAVFFAAAAILGALRFLKTGETRPLVTGGLAWGLGIATHPIVALLAPALLFALAARLRDLRIRPLALAFAAFLLGLACYAYLPARSAAVTQARLDPTLAIGLPPGSAFWDNDHPATWAGFLKEAGGEEYGAGGTFARMLRWHTYQTGLPPYLDALFTEMSPVAPLFFLAGLGVLWWRDDALALTLLFAFAFPTAFALAYTIEADPLRYDLTGYAVIAATAAFAYAQLLRRLNAPAYAGALSACVVALALLAVNRATFTQRTFGGYQAVIDRVVKNTPRNAVLVTPWLDATTLAYGAYVERRLDDRIVVAAWLSDEADRVPGWMRMRPVYVVGQLFGSVPGYQAIRVSYSPDIYKLAPLRASAPSR